MPLSQMGYPTSPVCSHPHYCNEQPNFERSRTVSSISGSHSTSCGCHLGVTWPAARAATQARAAHLRPPRSGSPMITISLLATPANKLDGVDHTRETVAQQVLDQEVLWSWLEARAESCAMAGQQRGQDSLCRCTWAIPVSAYVHTYMYIALLYKI